MDCPDWVLAEIQVLSKLTSIKLKLVVTEVIDAVIEKRDFDLDKLSNLTSGARIEVNEVRGVTAGIAFIVTSSAKYKTQKDVLSEELQQLGLPKEHATSLSKVYSDRQEALLSYLTITSQFHGHLASIKLVDKKPKMSGARYSVDVPYVKLKFDIETPDGKQESHVCFTREDLDNVIQDLESLRAQSDIYAGLT